MSDYRDFKDVESVGSEQLSHVSSQSALFQLLVEQGGLLSRDTNLQLDIMEYTWYLVKCFCWFNCICVDTLCRILNSGDSFATGSISMQASSGESVAESVGRNKYTIPMPSFPRSPSAKNSRIMEPTNEDFKSWTFPLKNSLLHKRFLSGRLDSKLRYHQRRKYFSLFKFFWSDNNELHRSHSYRSNFWEEQRHSHCRCAKIPSTICGEFIVCSCVVPQLLLPFWLLGCAWSLPTRLRWLTCCHREKHCPCFTVAERDWEFTTVCRGCSNHLWQRWKKGIDEMEFEFA